MSGPVEIAEVAKPALQDSSVLVEVYAASLNPIDNILRAGLFASDVRTHVSACEGL